MRYIVTIKQINLLHADYVIVFTFCYTERFLMLDFTRDVPQGYTLPNLTIDMKLLRKTITAPESFALGTGHFYIFLCLTIDHFTW